MLPNNIIVAGDSTGTGLVMLTLLGLRDADKSHLLPLATVSICGYFDLTKEPEDFVPPPHCVLSQPLMRGFRKAALANPEYQTEARKYLVVYSDLRGFPPVFVQAVSLDYLYKNSMDLVAKAKADGVLKNWEVGLHEGVAHDFTIALHSALPYAAVGCRGLQCL